MAAGPGVITWFDLPAAASASLDGTKQLLQGRLYDDAHANANADLSGGGGGKGNGDGASSSMPAVCNNIIALTTPGNMKLPHATVTVQAASSANADGSVDVTVTADTVALYVTLTTRAHGRFSDNAFMLTTDDQHAAGTEAAAAAAARSGDGALQRVIKFIPFNGSADIALLASSI